MPGAMLNLARRLSGLVARTVPVKSVTLRGRRAVASLTFDDFPQSAWTNGGPLLARHGARATYYVSGSFCGQTIDGTRFYDGADLHALRGAGHEIACHGFSHRATTALDHGALAADIARNQDFLAPYLEGEAPVSYAFPFGAVSLRTKRFFAGRYSNARGVHPGVNAGTADLADLRAISIERRSWDDARIFGAIAAAKTNRGWLVLFTHDVGDRPSEYGTTPAMLENVLSALAAAGIEVLPMREALRVATGDIS
jgi:peptidoglycan/xylan/chitin deacetylase (PgdA/CDA1 family)